MTIGDDGDVGDDSDIGDVGDVKNADTKEKSPVWGFLQSYFQTEFPYIFIEEERSVLFLVFIV